jgi:hypothetical protein
MRVALFTLQVYIQSISLNTALLPALLKQEIRKFVRSWLYLVPLCPLHVQSCEVIKSPIASSLWTYSKLRTAAYSSSFHGNPTGVEPAGVPKPVSTFYYMVYTWLHVVRMTKRVPHTRFSYNGRLTGSASKRTKNNVGTGRRSRTS